eukprot:scaffold37063_cov54-Phaeocystis_antarctica.AAC.7
MHACEMRVSPSQLETRSSSSLTKRDDSSAMRSTDAKTLASSDVHATCRVECIPTLAISVSLSTAAARIGPTRVVTVSLMAAALGAAAHERSVSSSSRATLYRPSVRWLVSTPSTTCSPGVDPGALGVAAGGGGAGPVDEGSVVARRVLP